MIDRIIAWVVNYRPPRQRRAERAYKRYRCWCGDAAKTNPHWKIEHGRWPY